MKTNQDYYLIDFTSEEIAILSHIVTMANYLKPGLLFDSLPFRLSLCLDGLKVKSLLLTHDELDKLVVLLDPTLKNKFSWTKRIDAGRSLYSKLRATRDNVFVMDILGKTTHSRYDGSHGRVVRFDVEGKNGNANLALIVRFSDGTEAVTPASNDARSFFE